jgi:type I restriction enzyme R subunit
VKGHGGKLDADLVRLVRYTLEQDDELVPHSEVVALRFGIWLREQEADGRSFTPEQLRWLEMVRDHIAASMSFDPAEDYDLLPFAEEGGITAAYELFGSNLRPLIDELNEQLTAA